MNSETKNQVIEALEAFIKQHDLSASRIAQETGVNPSYISQMRRGIFSTPVGDKEVEIKDMYFAKIADYIGFKIDKSFWEPVPTEQLKRAMATLEDAREFGYASVIIGPTGSGKTFTVNMFKRAHPGETFVVTVGSSDNILDLINKVVNELGLPETGSKSRKIQYIIRQLRTLRYNGYKPTLIFDESEYMKLASLCAMKELYDHLVESCALVMVGTEQLIRHLDRLRTKDKEGMPQFYRRIKFGIRYLPEPDRTYKLFLSNYSPELRRFLCGVAENYGELHDVLVPALREADRTGQPVTENFIRTILNMPRA